MLTKERVLRAPRARVRRRGKSFVSPEIMISHRPAEAADRTVPSHWEEDLILGLCSSAIGTLVERATRFTMLLHLPRLAGHAEAPQMKWTPPGGAFVVCRFQCCNRERASIDRTMA